MYVLSVESITKPPNHNNPNAVIVPVFKVLGDDEVFEMVVDGSLVVLQERVCVPQAIASLSLHRPVLQQPGQL